MLIIIAMLNGLSEESGLVQGAILGSVTQNSDTSRTSLPRRVQRAKVLSPCHGVRPDDCGVRSCNSWHHCTSHRQHGGTSSFVPFVIASQTLLFSSFDSYSCGTTLSAQRPSDYIVCEMTYLLLSLVCKATWRKHFGSRQLFCRRECVNAMRHLKFQHQVYDVVVQQRTIQLKL